MNSSVIKLFLVDDHTVVRQGLAKLLDAEPDFKVIGEAKNGREAIKRVEKLKPNVVLMDIAMPILNGIEATRHITKAVPQTKVIILSMHAHERYISELLRIGAAGYLLKDASGRDIIQAIHAVVKGDTYLSPSISRCVVEDYVSMKNKSPEEDRYGKLSNREREVFQMIVESRSTKEIADILCVSPSTVKTHRVNIMGKLQIDNMTDLIKLAVRMGIIDIEH
ncbi:MAG: response regulator transcription factor [Deltaproteobacteria bacterium]|nr:response regulator transcription factor [Deltaproteobacteria bacterium]